MEAPNGQLGHTTTTIDFGDARADLRPPLIDGVITQHRRPVVSASMLQCICQGQGLRPLLDPVPLGLEHLRTYIHTHRVVTLDNGTKMK